MGSFFIANILLAVVYIAARDRVQAQAINRARMLCWMLSSPTLGGCVAAFGLNGESNRVVQEVRGGSYDAFAYLAVHTVLQVLLMATITICAMALPGYAIHTLDPSASFSLGGYYTLTLLAFECVGQLCALVRNPLMGVMAYLLFWFFGFLFSGQFIMYGDVIWPLRVLCYVNPMRWGVHAVVHSDYVGSEWSGTMPCTPGTVFGAAASAMAKVSNAGAAAVTDALTASAATASAGQELAAATKAAMKAAKKAAAAGGAWSCMAGATAHATAESLAMETAGAKLAAAATATAAAATQLAATNSVVAEAQVNTSAAMAAGEIGICSTRGFYCPDENFGLMCFGRNGTEVLESMSRIADVFGGYSGDASEREMMIDAAALLTIAITAKLSYAFLLKLRCRS